jgi:hypothetical protein
MVATPSNPPVLLRFSASGMLYDRQERADWPSLDRIFASNVTLAAGEELYAINAAGSIARLPIAGDERPCRLTSPGYFMSTLSHLDADGVPDRVARESCTGCTSNHVIQYGQPG